MSGGTLSGIGRTGLGMGRTGKRLLLALATVAGIALLSACDPSVVQNFVVNTTTDAPDATPGDGICEATTDGDDCTLRAAIDEANAFGGITGITLAANETYPLTRAGADEDANDTGDLDLTEFVILEGNDSTIDAQQLDRVLDMGPTATLIAARTTFTGGEVLYESPDEWVTGGGIRAEGPLTLVSSAVTDNHTDDLPEILGTRGGGIWGTTVTLINTDLSNNQAQSPDRAEGGGVYAADLTIESGSTVDGNSVRRSATLPTFEGGGGGVHVTDLTITNSSVENNVVDADAVANGGGVHASTATLDAATVSGNSASAATVSSGRGGGVHASELEITDSTVNDNHLAAEQTMGGGIEASLLTMSGTTVSGNVIDVMDWEGAGAGVATSAPPAGPASTITDSTITDNDFTGIDFFSTRGGGLYLNHTTVSDTVVSGNRAQWGGGVWVGEHGGWLFSPTPADVTLSRVTLDDNLAFGSARGGGAGGEGAALHVVESTVSANTGTTGGGLYLPDGSTVHTSTVSGNTVVPYPTDGDLALGGGIYGLDIEITASTITQNVATPSAPPGVDGLFSEPGSTATMASTVVADNGALDCDATIVSSGHNLDSDGTCGLGDPSDQSSVAPLLGALADNGGPTLTHLPLAGSPLIDHVPFGTNGCGTVPDQRGVTRPQGSHCDIGAVEVELVLGPDEVAVNTATDAGDATPGDGICEATTDGDDCTLRAAIDETNAMAGAQTIHLQGGVTYALTLAGPNEDANATGDLDVTDDLTIEGYGATIDAQQLDRVLDSDAPFTVDQVTITGGEVLASSGDGPEGGGIRAGQLELIGATIDGNRVEDDAAGSQIARGGGVWATGSTVTLSTISNNEVTQPLDGGGAYGGGIASYDLTLADSTVQANHATGNAVLGGGVVANAPVITGTTITGNILDISGSGGTPNGIYGGWGAGLHATASGGGEALITDTTVSENEILGDGVLLGGGGGLSLDDATVFQSTIEDNRASVGGGVFTEGGTVVLEAVTITGNEAVIGDSGGGGGVAQWLGGDLHLVRSTVSDNLAQIGGGLGVFYGPTTFIEHSTISGNHATDRGGGMVTGQNTTVNVSWSTIMANTADVGADAIDEGGFSLTLLATVVASNDAGADCDGGFISLGYNVSLDATCSLTEPTDLTGVNPKLGALGDFGGPTLTHRPAGNSPLLNLIPVGTAGCGTEPDQRGVTRPQGTHCDVGSVER